MTFEPISYFAIIHEAFAPAIVEDAIMFGREHNQDYAAFLGITVEQFYTEMSPHANRRNIMTHNELGIFELANLLSDGRVVYQRHDRLTEFYHVVLFPTRAAWDTYRAKQLELDRFINRNRS